MKKQTLKNAMRIGLSLMLTFMTVLAHPALAQNSKAWTSVASAGVVDDEDIAKVAMPGAHVVQLAVGGGASASATIRYNVTATEGLFTPLGVPRMRVRYSDNGAAAQVLVRLIRVSLLDGSTTQMLELNSNDFAGTGFQIRTTAPCESVAYGFDFTNYAYFVEAKLTRNNNGGSPKLGAIQLYSEVHNACHGGSSN
jgi:hypothetical protein